MKLRISALIVLFAVCSPAAGLAGALSRIYICPGDMLFRPRMQQQFQVFGLDADGNDVPVPGPITWSADASAGSITSAGLFTAGTSIGMFICGVTASVPGGFSAVCVIEIASPSPSAGFTLDSSWGNFGWGHLNGPEGIVVGPNGNVYVNDTFGNRIYAFDSTGHCLNMWGRYGSTSRAHYDWAPGGMAVDASGMIYEADYSSGSIRKFDPSGCYVGSIGSYGSGNGQFLGVSDVAVDSNGYVYGADYQTDSIQKFDSTGKFITKWGSYGTADGQFKALAGISVDPGGRVYAADSEGDCVKVFSSDGTYIAKWTCSGTLRWPSEVHADPSGYVYIHDANYGISKFDQQGNRLMSWPNYSRDLNGLVGSTCLASSSDGYLYVTSPEGNVVQKYTTSGALVTSWGAEAAMRGQFNCPSGVCLDQTGNIYVLDHGNCRVQVFDPNRRFLRTWGSYGDGDQQLSSPSVMALAGGYVYILDGSRVKKFDLYGQFIKKWGTLSSSRGGFVQPEGMAADSSGNIYVGDTGRYRVLRFDSQGSFIDEWGAQGTADSQFSSVHAVGVDGLGYVYVADLGNNAIKKFDSQGRFVLKILPRPGGQIGIDGFAFDAAGGMYVAGVGQVDVYDASGNWLKKVGAIGSDAGRFRGLAGVTVDNVGNLYVADFGNNRVQKFIPQIPTNSTGTLKSLPDGQYVSISGQIVTADSNDIETCCYMEAPDRSAGIKVTGVFIPRGYVTSVDGNLATVDGERELQATTTSFSSGSVTLKPFGISAGAMGGGQIGLQEGVKGQQPDGPAYRSVAMNGLSNVGMLVRTWGKVVSRDTVAKTFYIRDGSGIDLKCKVPSWGVTVPGVDDYVGVTGISSTEKNASGDVIPLLRVRMASDIKTM